MNENESCFIKATAFLIFTFHSACLRESSCNFKSSSSKLNMESRCKIIRCESVLCFALVCFLIINYKPFSTAQPLLNSLAVMLRARPPWPALYPAMKEPHFYSSSVLNPLITSAARQQGILVAHPITNVNYVRPQFQLAQTQLLSPVINSNAQNIQNDLVSAYSNSFQPTNEYPVEVHLEQNEKGIKNFQNL